MQLSGTMSGGQKARLAFASVMYNAPHVLILDEPTNHLDRDSLESLANAVEEFEGAVVTVSHNQHLMSQSTKEMWTVINGRVKTGYLMIYMENTRKVCEKKERNKDRKITKRSSRRILSEEISRN